MGDLFVAALPWLVDDAGHTMAWGPWQDTMEVRTLLWQDGELVADVPELEAWSTLPEGGAQMRLQRDVTIHHPHWARSTQVSTSWEFTAQPQGDMVEPVESHLLDIDYGVSGLDDLNRTRRNVKVALTVLDETAAPADGVQGVRLWSSADGGQTWTEVRLKGSGPDRTGQVKAPKGATSISLKVKAWTGDARFTETVTDAWGVGRPGR